MKKEKNPPCEKCGKELKTHVGHTTYTDGNIKNPSAYTDGDSTSSYTDGGIYTGFTDCDDTTKDNVIPLVNYFSHISVMDLEEIMEWFDDNEYLSEKGKEFRTKFWEMFIKRS
jgi:hypothetical protein